MNLRKATMSFTIYRSKWIHTKKDLKQSSVLLRSSDNKMCCLGFAGKAAGVAPKDLRDRGRFSLSRESVAFYNLPRVPKQLKWLLKPDKKSEWQIEPANLIQDALIRINDSRALSRAEKERRIKAAFAEHNIHVAFKP